MSEIVSEERPNPSETLFRLLHNGNNQWEAHKSETMNGITILRAPGNGKKMPVRLMLQIKIKDNRKSGLMLLSPQEFEELCRICSGENGDRIRSALELIERINETAKSEPTEGSGNSLRHASKKF